MAIHLIPSSYRCGCGHEAHFSERTIREMKADSQRRREPIRILDSEKDKHAIEFSGGEAVAVICPKLRRCEITGWE